MEIKEIERMLHCKQISQLILRELSGGLPGWNVSLVYETSRNTGYISYFHIYKNTTLIRINYISNKNEFIVRNYTYDFMFSTGRTNDPVGVLIDLFHTNVFK